MKPAQLMGLFAASLCLFLLAQVPLAAVVKWAGVAERGLAYRRAEGTVWSGTLREASWQGYALGDVALSFRPAALLLGRLSLRVALDGRGLVAGQGTVGWGIGSGLSVRNALLSADVARMPTLIPMAGEVSVAVGKVSFGNGGCRDADAVIETDTLTKRPGGMAWSGPVLTGQLSCDDGDLVLPLQGGSGGESIATRLIVHGDLSFDIEVLVRTQAADVNVALPAFGFRKEDGMLVLRQNGRWG